MSHFPSLSGFEPTRQTLHLYARAIAAVPRAHAAFHPQWWHISLRVTPNGLKTSPFGLPSGAHAWLEMDLQHHLAALQDSQGGRRAFDMRAGATAAEFGDQILRAVAELGLAGEYARDRLEDEGQQEYDAGQATNFFTALSHANRIFADHRARLIGSMGPIQLWPHNFDLAFEWFGSRVVQYEEHGEVRSYPAQLNLGFFPGGDPYFYSNPWPFESEQLLGRRLPEGAAWHTEGWQGTILPYSVLENDPEAEERLLDYAMKVYELAHPTLTS